MEGRPAARPILTFAVIICTYLSYAQEYSVGINTNNPNPNAVLQLVSPNGNQGLLVPQLTTTQRTQMQLSAAENGLLVYDVSEGVFYYWHAASWNPLGSATGPTEGSTMDEIQQLTKTGNLVSLSKSGGSFTDEVDDADSDPENELQTLTRAGNVISLSDGGSFSLTEGEPLSGQQIQWNGTDWIPVTPAGAQSLSFEGTQLSISGGNAIDLSDLTDGDGDPLNEIQTLSLAGDQLSLSKDGAVIDLASYKDQLTEEQVDAYVANNGYVETEQDPTVPESLKDGVDWSELTGIPDLSIYLDNSDNQDLILTGDILSLTGDASTVDLGPYLDNTDAQTLSLTGDQLSLTNGGSVDLAAYAIDNVDDADADATNEIQDLKLEGNILSLTGDASTVNLTPYLDNTDEQSLDFTSGVISLMNDPTATSIDLSNYDTDVTDDFDGVFSSLSGIPAGLSDGDDVNDADANPENEIQDLLLSGDNLTITNNAGATAIDLSGYLDNTDAQDLTLTSNTLSLTGDGTSVDLSGYLDNTDAQDLGFTGGVISLSGDPDATVINLSNYDSDVTDDFDGAFSSLTGIPAGLSDGDDVGDADATNELQDLVYSGNILSLSGDPNPTTVDFSAWDQNASDDFDGTWASLSGKPTGLDDGDDVLTPTDVKIYALSDDRLKQELSFSNGIISLTGSSNDINLSTWDLDISKTNELITDMFVAANDSLYIIEGGVITSTDVRTSASDRRLKKNIIPVEDALRRIQQISGYTYYLKSDSGYQYLKTGVIAQEVEEVFPSIVKERADGFLGVTYQEFIPILIEALKEQQAMIDQLQTEVTSLQSTGGDQEERITALEGKLEMIMNLMTK